MNSGFCVGLIVTLALVMAWHMTSLVRRLTVLEAQHHQVQTQVQQIIVDLPERWFWRKGETRP